MANKEFFLSDTTLNYLIQHISANKVMDVNQLATMLYIDLQTAFEDGKLSAQSIRDFYTMLWDKYNERSIFSHDPYDQLIVNIMVAYKNVIQHDLPPAAGVVKH